MKSFIGAFVVTGMLLISNSHALSASSFATQENQTTQRIVSAGGSITEILFALGANQPGKHHIVATDTSSSFPELAKQLPKIGYYRQLSVEGILSVDPSVVLAARGAGPSDVLKQLEQIGVELVLFEQAKTVPGLLDLIKNVGASAGQIERAKQLQLSLKQQLQKAQQNKIRQDVSVVFLMSVSQRGLMAAGSDTVPNLIMDLAGISNPYSALEGFKVVSQESLLASAPKHILIASHTTGGLSSQEMCQQALLKQWAETQGCNVHLVDSLMFLGMTPRLPQAVDTFIKLVAPEQLAKAQ